MELAAEDLLKLTGDGNLRRIADLVLAGKRLSEEDALYLFRSRELAFIGSLAEQVNRRRNGLKAYFIVNRQINPTNVCLYRCTFCAFGVGSSGR